MDWPKVSIVLVCLATALVHLTCARSSFQDLVDAHNTASSLIWGDIVAAPPLTRDNPTAAGDQGHGSSPQDFVDAHNAARVEVGVLPLVWDDTVADYAQRYAKKRSRDCAMQHSTGPYGENLAAGSWDLSAKEAVGMWADEKKSYDLASNACAGGECRHYTQLVWRGSTRVGCAKVHCLNGWTFVTCNYDPPGNFIGERPF